MNKRKLSLFLAMLLAFFQLQPPSVGFGAGETETIVVNTAYNAAAPYIYTYTGAQQTFNIPQGVEYVKVRLWGAQGANVNPGIGGYGHYVEGIVDVRNLSMLYVYTGGRNGSLNNNSYNGGGMVSWGAGAGGGATDIRTTGGAWDNSESLNSRIVVAGGGHGAGYYSNSGGASYNTPIDARDLTLDIFDGVHKEGATWLSNGAGAPVLGTGAGSWYHSLFGGTAAYTNGGGGGGYYGGDDGYSGQPYISDTKIKFGFVLTRVNQGTGRVEITPLSAQDVVTQKRIIDLSTQPAERQIAVHAPLSDVEFVGNQTVDRKVAVSSAKDVILTSNAQLVTKINATNMTVTSTPLSLIRANTLSNTVTITGSNVSGSSLGSITSNALRLVNSTLAAGSWNINTTGDINIVNTPFINGIFNGISAMSTNISVNQSDMGLNAIYLNGYYSNYMTNPSVAKNGGTIPMHFALERNDGSGWVRGQATAINLAENSVLRDLDTAVGKATQYRVAFKRNDKTGYVVIEDNVVSATSPGSFMIDDVPPTISLFSMASGNRQVDTDRVNVSVVANDSRSTADKLTMQLQVGANRYKWDTTQSAYVAAANNDDYGPYVQDTTGLLLTEGVNAVTVRVRDQANNTGMAMAQIAYVKAVGSTVAPDMTTEQLNTAVTVVGTVSEQPLETILLRGVSYLLSNDGDIKLTFDTTKLPAGVKHVRYSISGDNYSANQSIQQPVNLQMPPMSGVHNVRFMFVNEMGIQSTTPTRFRVIVDTDAPSVVARLSGGATIVRGATANVQLTITDNYSSTFEYSTNNGASWQAVPANKIVSLSVATGRTQNSILVRDQGKNETSADIAVWRIN